MLASASPIDILSFDRVIGIPGCGLAITFTDGTKAYYPPEELAQLRPHRERIENIYERPPVLDKCD
jgi:hypothetical protein